MDKLNEMRKKVNEAEKIKHFVQMENTLRNMTEMKFYQDNFIIINK